MSRRRCQDVWKFIDKQDHEVDVEHCKNWAVGTFKGKHYCFRHLARHEAMEIVK